MVDSTNLPEVDINAIATDLNNKLDRDCLNYSDTGYNFMAGAGMPSDKYINLTLGASGTTYTAPANGYFCIKASNDGATSSYQSNYSTSYGGRGQITSYGYSSNGGAIVPMTKGQTMTFVYETNARNCSITFVYAQGSESEA